jgi:hypothetical protein
MTPTEIMLFAAHRSPAVPLDAICRTYFNLEPDTASHYAGLRRLPVPAFRLNDSRKAPWMVDLKVLAAHIDSQARDAAVRFEHSSA